MIGTAFPRWLACGQACCFNSRCAGVISTAMYILGLAMVYGLLYCATIFFKLVFVQSNDGFIDWFSFVFQPAMYVHATLQYQGPISGRAKFAGANYYGDKVFIEQNGITYAVWMKYCQSPGDLREGDEVEVIIETGAPQSDDTYRVYFAYECSRLRKSAP